MIQLNALYAFAMTLVLLPIQTAFAEVGDVSISGVEFKDLSDRRLSGPPGATQLMLSAIVTNNTTQPVSYVAFLELRDSNGVTQYLQFHMGRLDPEASNNIASSWTPDKIGEYELRVFAISSFENPDILSSIETATTTIS